MGWHWGWHWDMWGASQTCVKGTALGALLAQHRCRAGSCCCPIALLWAEIHLRDEGT